MRRTLTLVALALFVPAALAFADGPKVQLKAKKGDTCVYSVQKTSSTDGGAFKMNNATEIEYKIEVADAKDGELELKVTYGAIKTKQESSGGQGGGQTWEYDSSKPAGDDEAAKTLKETTSKPITVKVKDGKIADVKGFPEVQRPEDGQGGPGAMRGMRARMIAGRMALEGDLSMILALPVQGQTLEKDKEYKAVRPEAAAGGEGKKGGRGRGGFGGRFGMPGLVYKYQGEEKDAAKFAISPEQFGPAPQESKAEGSAQVSLKDGMLLQLTSKSESKREFDRNGEKSTFSMSSKVEVKRCAPKGAGVQV
jgi:hypothetical protein